MHFYLTINIAVILILLSVKVNYSQCSKFTKIDPPLERLLSRKTRALLFPLQGTLITTIVNTAGILPGMPRGLGYTYEFDNLYALPDSADTWPWKSKKVIKSDLPKAQKKVDNNYIKDKEWHSDYNWHSNKVWNNSHLNYSIKPNYWQSNMKTHFGQNSLPFRKQHSYFTPLHYYLDENGVQRQRRNLFEKFKNMGKFLSLDMEFCILRSICEIKRNYLLPPGISMIQDIVRILLTDILKLRDLMRTKFFYYRCQQNVYESEKKQKYQTKLYENMQAFYKLCYNRMAQVELESFTQMQIVYKELKALEMDNLEDELEKLELEHQKILMEVKKMYRQFRYLLKLIDYFDNVSTESDSSTTLNDLLNNGFGNFLEMMPDNHSVQDIAKFQLVLKETVKPYLKKNNYLNIELWQTGFKSMQRKIFNFIKHLSSSAILNHIVQIVHDKFTKSYNLRTQKRIFLKSPEFLKFRSDELKNNTNQLFGRWETMLKQDLVGIEIESVVPTMLNHLKLDDRYSEQLSSTMPDDIVNTTLEIVIEIQSQLMAILNKLDNIEPQLLHRIERHVIKEIVEEKKASKLALVQQIRIQNLVNHYKSHYKKKDISSNYITVLPRKKQKTITLKKKCN